MTLSDLVVDDELARAVEEAVRSGWWSMGPRVEAFEHAFATGMECRHAIAVANGTAALHLALLAVGVEPGDEVIVPSLNFVAAANTIRHVGAVPVFCDILGGDSLNLDPADVADAIGPRTRAILALHYGGYACDIDALADLARRHDLVLVEDAAHAPLARTFGRACGTIGDAGCFSFFSNKNLPVGEGGMVVTNDDDVAARLRLLRSHGMTTLTWDRHRGHASTYDVVLHGFNYRLDEIKAAAGLVQLRALPAANAARRRAVARYRELLDGAVEMPFASTRPEETSAAHLAVVVLPDGVERGAVQARLREHGIQTSVHYPPIHEFTAFAGYGARALPQTDAVSRRILTLPLHPSLGDDQIELVAASLRQAVAAPRATLAT